MKKEILFKPNLRQARKRLVKETQKIIYDERKSSTLFQDAAFVKKDTFEKKDLKNSLLISKLDFRFSRMDIHIYP